MQTLSLLMLILLSLVAYSAGAAARAGKRYDLRPQLGDLAAIVLVWAAALATRSAWPIGRWGHLGIWVGLAGVAGFAAASFRKLKVAAAPPGVEAPATSLSAVRKLLQGWTSFSRRMGHFQSRVLMSFFFFIVVTPFALLVKAFSDPLRIKRPSGQDQDTCWLPKRPVNSDGSEYHRQF